MTLRDVYHCAIDKELFAKKIEQAQTYAREIGDEWITIDAAELDVDDDDQIDALRALGFSRIRRALPAFGRPPTRAC